MLHAHKWHCTDFTLRTNTEYWIYNANFSLVIQETEYTRYVRAMPSRLVRNTVQNVKYSSIYTFYISAKAKRECLWRLWMWCDAPWLAPSFSHLISPSIAHFHSLVRFGIADAAEHGEYFGGEINSFISMRLNCLVCHAMLCRGERASESGEKRVANAISDFWY